MNLNAFLEPDELSVPLYDPEFSTKTLNSEDKWIIAHLSLLEQELLWLRYDLNKTLQHIAKMKFLSQPHVSWIIKQSIRKIRIFKLLQSVDKKDLMNFCTTISAMTKQRHAKPPQLLIQKRVLRAYLKCNSVQKTAKVLGFKHFERVSYFVTKFIKSCNSVKSHPLLAEKAIFYQNVFLQLRSCNSLFFKPQLASLKKGSTDRLHRGRPQMSKKVPQNDSGCI